jgi:hypothetical protein
MEKENTKLLNKHLKNENENKEFETSLLSLYCKNIKNGN